VAPFETSGFFSLHQTSLRRFSTQNNREVTKIKAVFFKAVAEMLHACKKAVFFKSRIFQKPWRYMIL